MVELNLQQLVELGGKARFYRERLDKVGFMWQGWRGAARAPRDGCGLVPASHACLPLERLLKCIRRRMVDVCRQLRGAP